MQPPSCSRSCLLDPKEHNHDCWVHTSTLLPPGSTRAHSRFLDPRKHAHACWVHTSTLLPSGSTQARSRLLGPHGHDPHEHVIDAKLGALDIQAHTHSEACNPTVRERGRSNSRDTESSGSPPVCRLLVSWGWAGNKNSELERTRKGDTAIWSSQWIDPCLLTNGELGLATMAVNW
eukprot:1148178-Pelagomonas_calceolata.AAC.2